MRPILCRLGSECGAITVVNAASDFYFLYSVSAPAVWATAAAATTASAAATVVAATVQRRATSEMTGDERDNEIYYLLIWRCRPSSPFSCVRSHIHSPHSTPIIHPSILCHTRCLVRLNTSGERVLTRSRETGQYGASETVDSWPLLVSRRCYYYCCRCCRCLQLLLPISRYSAATAAAAAVVAACSCCCWTRFNFLLRLSLGA